jgi:DNA gyrase inhibitor GyrI
VDWNAIRTGVSCLVLILRGTIKTMAQMIQKVFSCFLTEISEKSDAKPRFCSYTCNIMHANSVYEVWRKTNRTGKLERKRFSF